MSLPHCRFDSKPIDGLPRWYHNLEAGQNQSFRLFQRARKHSLMDPTATLPVYAGINAKQAQRRSSHRKCTLIGAEYRSFSVITANRAVLRHNRPLASKTSFWCLYIEINKNRTLILLHNNSNQRAVCFAERKSSWSRLHGFYTGENGERYVSNGWNYTIWCARRLSIWGDHQQAIQRNAEWLLCFKTGFRGQLYDLCADPKRKAGQQNAAGFVRARAADFD